MLKILSLNKSIKLISGVFIIGFGLWISSCNNAFLSETDLPEIYSSADTILVTSGIDSFSLDLDIGASNGSWRLYQFPQWLDITPKEGILNSSSIVNFKFVIDHNITKHEYGLFIYPLVFQIEEMKLEQKTIAFLDYGKPSIDVFPRSLYLETYLKGEISISNNNNGLLFWEVTHKPSWLSFNATSDVYLPYTTYPYKYKVITTNLEQGNYNDSIVIKNSAGTDMIIPVVLKIANLGFNGTYHTGNLIASEYIKKLNKLAVITSNPDRLYFFNEQEGAPEIVELKASPESLALSENEDLLAIGYENNQISVYNAKNGELTKTYDTGLNPVLIEFGTENYLYFVGQSFYSECLHRLNLNSGQIIKSTQGENGYGILIKVPNRNILVASKPGYLPDGLTFYFVGTSGNLNFKNEYPMGVNGFWLSDDGKRIFTGTQSVYETPDYDPNLVYIMDNHPKLISKLKFGNEFDIRCIAQQSTTEKLFVAFSDGPFSKKTYISQFHHTTFAKQKSFAFSSLLPEDFPESKTWYETTVNIYPAKNGLKLWLVQKYSSSKDFANDTWSVRTLKLD